MKNDLRIKNHYFSPGNCKITVDFVGFKSPYSILGKTSGVIIRSGKKSCPPSLVPTGDDEINVAGRTTLTCKLIYYAIKFITRLLIFFQVVFG